MRCLVCQKSANGAGAIKLEDGTGFCSGKCAAKFIDKINHVITKRLSDHEDRIGNLEKQFYGGK